MAIFVSGVETVDQNYPCFLRSMGGMYKRTGPKESRNSYVFIVFRVSPLFLLMMKQFFW